jgi:hypothetical protein
MPPLDCYPRNSRSKLLNPFSGLGALRLVAALDVQLATAIPTPPPLTVR